MTIFLGMVGLLVGLCLMAMLVMDMCKEATVAAALWKAKQAEEAKATDEAEAARWKAAVERARPSVRHKPRS
jgi:hypothetical protein